MKRYAVQNGTGLRVVVGGDDGMVTVAEAAKRLGVSTTWVRDRIVLGWLDVDRSVTPMLVRVDGVRGLEGLLHQKPHVKQPNTEESRSAAAKAGWARRRKAT